MGLMPGAGILDQVASSGGSPLPPSGGSRRDPPVNPATLAALMVEAEELRRCVAEKDLLLRELRHRVKNSLMILSCLLEADSAQVADEAARVTLQAARSRVQSVAELYEQLGLSSHPAVVELGPYLERLVASLRATVTGCRTGLSVVTRLDDIDLDLKRALPLGLIVNELVTNALKHAWTDGRGGKVGVRLSGKEGRLLLEVSDQGRGMAEGSGQEASPGLGLELVRALSLQLKADFRLTAPKAGGTRARLAFRI